MYCELDRPRPKLVEHRLVDNSVFWAQDLEFKDGTCYNGKIWRWMRSKEGKISFPNGDTYEGGFKQDRFMGEVRVLNEKSRHLE
jgi:hypothetical protein